MQWLQSQSPGLTLLMIVVGLAVALVLLFWIFRKIAGTGVGRRDRNKPPRLAVTDAAPVDDKRRLVLVRRDNVEHLVMIGGASDVLIESNITRASARSMAGTREEPTMERDTAAPDADPGALKRHKPARSQSERPSPAAAIPEARPEPAPEPPREHSAAMPTAGAALAGGTAAAAMSSAESGEGAEIPPADRQHGHPAAMQTPAAAPPEPVEPARRPEPVEPARLQEPVEPARLQEPVEPDRRPEPVEYDRPQAPAGTPQAPGAAAESPAAEKRFSESEPSLEFALGRELSAEPHELRPKPDEVVAEQPARKEAPDDRARSFEPVIEPETRASPTERHAQPVRKEDPDRRQESTSAKVEDEMQRLLDELSNN